jgi:hypothetical protein
MTGRADVGDELRAINSAYRLGDTAVPPDGCLLKLFPSANGKHIFGVLEVRRLRSSTVSVDREVDVWAVDVETMTYCALTMGGVWRGESFEVVDVPEDAPPFVVWDRAPRRE